VDELAGELGATVLIVIGCTIGYMKQKEAAGHFYRPLSDALELAPRPGFEPGTY
jgi:hypothetical protein